MLHGSGAADVEIRFLSLGTAADLTDEERWLSQPAPELDHRIAGGHHGHRGAAPADQMGAPPTGGPARVGQVLADWLTGPLTPWCWLTGTVVLAGEPVEVQTSIGVTWSDDTAIDPEQLVAAADDAMYATKRAGDGRPVVAELCLGSELPPPGLPPLACRRWPAAGTPVAGRAAPPQPGRPTGGRRSGQVVAAEDLRHRRVLEDGVDGVGDQLGHRHHLQLVDAPVLGDREGVGDHHLRQR